MRRPNWLLETARIGAALGSLLVCGGALANLPPSAWAATGLLAAAAVWRPVLAMSAFLFALPWLGDQPGTPQLRWLVALASGLNVGLLTPVGSRLLGPETRLGHPLVLLTAFYVVASALSLSTLPLVDLARALTGDSSGLLRPWLDGASRVVAASHLTVEYPVLSVVLTAYAAGLALAMLLAMQRDGEAARLFSKAILASVVTTVVVGLLDYYQVIDLSRLRQLDPEVNRGGIQVRLQSTFGHSGWFGEFLTLGLPFLVLVFAARRPHKGQLLGFMGLLALSQACLLVTYQRGAWLTHAVVVLGLLAVVGVRAGPESPDDRKPHAGLRVRFVLAGVCLALLAATAIFAADALVGRDLSFRWSSLQQRVGEFSIPRVAGRLPYIKVGFRLGSVHPVLGGGSESFAYQYLREYLQPDGLFATAGNPLDLAFGSAHNVYSQTFAGKGLVGLFLLLALCFTGLWRAFRGARAATRGLPDPILMLACTGAIGGFIVHGLVQEFFYIQTLQYLFFAVLAFVAALDHSTTVWSKWWKRGAATLLVAFAAHLGYEYGSPGLSRQRLVDSWISASGWRLGELEEDPSGHRYRWSAGRAVLSVPETASAFTLSLRSLAPVAQRVTVSVEGVKIDHVLLDDHGWRALRYTLHRRAPSGGYQVMLDVSPTWTAPGDERTLGVMVGELSWTPRPHAPRRLEP